VKDLATLGVWALLFIGVPITLLWALIRVVHWMWETPMVGG
jgi:hypothetical protein